MPSLKEIKTRIASVKSTRKITSAMKMVASSKLHHAQVAIQNMLPYENLLEHILKSFLVSMPEPESVFQNQREVKTAALIVFSSNNSLCGGFNANVIKMMWTAVQEYQAKGIKVLIYPIGQKVAEAVRKLGLQSIGNYQDLVDKPNAQQCEKIGRDVALKFLKGDLDHVELIYHHFKSAGRQILTRKVFLPIDLSTEAIGADNDRDLSSNKTSARVQEYLRKKRETEQRGKIQVAQLNDDFIIEPDLKTVLQSLVPKLLHLMIYTALLDSLASEHAARMVAMQTATDNADDILHNLNLQYNKSRQQAITNELLDMEGGSVRN
ncbi:MAG: F0F1 ATP synthase subunit gamma [Prevotella sp.]|jgi:F-type H+-transporting ATPase subunit gamma|nr:MULTISPECIES: F0F1 ATP synthase subunit gamma [unclassified Prevotella]MCH3969231.1 F0F1 ATP synthase subunit gamma [Prevotella sp.]MCH3985427.1 F0F1 ATP synthase subunit gamma [Prevotella sp.]MCH3991920.1 F0F1 ATP synthase subunit gamma [Prevotella sp.]MCH4017512.1 F0F1 ATP synthase subunit gamma [Prevotella sp.]MCH4185265.1 F0F1 ATP synthase subunit gamma [Prevotella sp.]